MLDKESRSKLRDIVSRSVRKASSKVSTEVKAEQGDFAIVINPTSIDHFYKNEKVASLKMAEADEELIDFIRNDPEETASILLEEYIDGFGKTASTIKLAANSALDGEISQKITEKQLKDNNVDLHPRAGSYDKITEKILGDKDEHKGSHFIITEGQLRDETTTPKGEQLGNARVGENRDGITEKQLGTEADQTGAKRGEMGSEFSGDQSHMIGDKQIQELLSHHGWTEPHTITQDQLTKQKGELARLEASSAKALVKEALHTLARTVAALGVTPDEVISTVKSLTSSPYKEPVIASLLSNPQNVNDIKQALKRYRFHGKVASANTSTNVIASAILRQLSNIKADSRLVASTLYALAGTDENSITEALDEAVTSQETETQTQNDDIKSVLAEIVKNKNYKLASEDTEPVAHENGVYEDTVKIENISEDPANREEFAKAAYAYSKTRISKKASIDSDNLLPLTLRVNENDKTYTLTMKDSSFIDPEVLKVRAARRAQLAKEAQMPAGGMPPGPGGAAGGMGTPPMPGAAADPGAAPPMESFTAQPPPDELGDEEPSGSNTPKPPGTSCPVCGSEDVDVDHGQFRCQNSECGAEGDIEVLFRIRKYPDVLQESEKEDAGEGDLGEGFELGEGLESPEGLEAPMGEPGAPPPNVPVAANVRITPRMLEKLAAKDVKLGGVCPSCGSNRCDLDKGKGICFACNKEYNVKVYANKKEPHKLMARFEWVEEAPGCTSCNRLKVAFNQALKDYGMSFDEFHEMDWEDKGRTILKMKRANVMGKVEAKVREFSRIEKLASSTSKFDAFPKQSCIERLARRFGENASSMSGPCHGKNLPECVCSQLENLGVYTDGLAAKVAQVHMSNDPEMQFPTDECIKKLQNKNFRLKESGYICDCLKSAFASYEDLLIEKVANSNPNGKKVKTAQLGNPPSASKPLPELSAPAPTRPLPKDDFDDELDGGPDDDLDSESLDSAMDSDFDAEPELSSEAPTLDEDVDSDEMGMDEALNSVGPEVEPEISEEVDVTETPGGEVDVTDVTDITETPETGLPETGLPETEIGGEGDLVDVTDAVTTSPAQQIGEAIQTAIDQAVQKAVGGGVDTAVDSAVEGIESLPETSETPEPPDLGPESEVPDEGSTMEKLDVAEGHEHFEDESGQIRDETGELEAPEDIEIVEDKSEEDIPGLGDQESVVGEGIAKEGDEPKPLPNDDEEYNKVIDKVSPLIPLTNLSRKPKNQSNDSSEKPENEKPDEETEKEASIYNLLSKMKKGTITKEAQSLDNLIEGLVKIAEKEPEKFKYINVKEKKVNATPAQDTSDIGTISNKSQSKMGEEESFETGVSTKPDVPRKKQLLGAEDDKLGVSEDGDKPSIPAGAPAMQGEEHYKPEKQTEVDGNQGGTVTANKKTASHGNCKCNDPTCKCDCDSKACAKPCPTTASVRFTQNSKYYNALTQKLAEGKKVVKLAGSIYKIAMNTDKSVSANKVTKVSYVVTPENKLYKGLKTKLASKETTVTLNDGVEYEISTSKENIILAAKKKKDEVHVKMQNPKHENKPKLPKKAQSAKSLTRKEDGLADDPDLNHSGKTHTDKTHSLAVDEVAPSEGVKKPDVPTAPSKGQLKNEHTFDNTLKGPEVPTGGGSNKKYDTNEDYDPEKTTETLGLASTETYADAKVDLVKEATRIAGEMLKKSMITPDELQDKISYLSQLPMPLLKQYESEMITKKADLNIEAGLQKKASKDDVEVGLLITKGRAPESHDSLKEALQDALSCGKNGITLKDLREI